jgi:hypothetical protein
LLNALVQAREAANAHPRREVQPLDMGRADVLLVRVAEAT